MFLFKIGIFGSTCPEVPEGFLLIFQALLKQNTGYIVGPDKFLFERDKTFFSFRVRNTLATFVVSICAKTKSSTPALYGLVACITARLGDALRETG